MILLTYSNISAVVINDFNVKEWVIKFIEQSKTKNVYSYNFNYYLLFEYLQFEILQKNIQKNDIRFFMEKSNTKTEVFVDEKGNVDIWKDFHDNFNVTSNMLMKRVGL